jgi:tol-pal system protein YbgF
MKKFTYFMLASLLLGATTFSAFAEDNATVEDRISRLERLVNSNGLVDVMVRVESMQSELQRLQGEIEVQKHTLDEIKKRQRDLYLDIDRRLLQIERRSGTTSTLPPVTAPATPAASSVMNDAKADSEPEERESESSAVSAADKSGNKESEQVAYQKAFDLLRALRYDKATQAFRQFLVDYPNGRYAHIAQYWLAETSYHTRKFTTAVKDYKTLIEQYPKSPKRADALLKIGYSQYELKAYAEAKEVLEQLIQSYPGTTEAGQAQNLLQKLRVEKLQ